MTDFEEVNGYLWPKTDKECRKVAFNEREALDRVYPHVSDWSACIQAGGNCGVWANALSLRFAEVYTFEPDARNFHCLVRNCTADNIHKFQAALGAGSERPHDLKRDSGNCGAHQLLGAGTIPVLPIDALNLPTLGLLYLDVEGYEVFALLGAKATITRCRPIIAIENKSLSIPYGYRPERVVQTVEEMGYKKVGRHGNDIVFAPL